MLLSGSRIMYGMAKKNRLPKSIGKSSAKRKTPVVAIALSCLISILFLGFGDISDIAYITNFTLFVTFAVINAAVIALRFQIPDFRRPFKVPGSVRNVPVIPIAGLVTCLFFLSKLDMRIMAIGLVIVIILFILDIVFHEKP